MLKWHQSTEGYMSLRIKIFLFLTCLIVPAVAAAAGLNLENLPESDIQKAKDLIVKLEPLIREREAAQTLATLTFDELYAPLSDADQQFMKSFADIDAKAAGVKIPFRGIATGKEELTVIRGQQIKIKGEDKELPPQSLPPDVYARYEEMMAAMEKDLGKRLYVESGYRSSAYQLYLFVYYLKNHAFSIRETVKFITLPGYSEHGSVEHQAIDFINAEGINGEDNPPEFAALEEYAWLKKHAYKFGFTESYPQMPAGSGITYEPWHWRFEKLLEN